MSSHFAKPENALSKAIDLVKVDKPEQAIRTLHEMMLSRRYRAWQQTHEKIMLLYIKLAADLRHSCKEVLVQYRLICQSAQSASLEKVIGVYRDLSEEKAALAVKEAGVMVVNCDLDDTSITPESILALAFSSTEALKSRTDREVLIPWLKYLWETYRTILEVLRNNKKMEDLYHQIARQAFDFCLRFRRFTEFRRLCEILRSHITNILNFSSQTNAVDLTSLETQSKYLKTRFEQLQVASGLELWQEAYRTIEDIHDIMLQMRGNEKPKAQLYNTYYHKLSRIFWASNNNLFHAYSLVKYYSALFCSGNDVSSVTENGVVEQREDMAAAVVLATLIISPSENSDSLAFSSENENNVRLAKLLGFNKEAPTRARLQEGLLNVFNVFAYVPANIKRLYELLEVEFCPLTLTAQLTPIVDELEKNPNLVQYVQPLKQMVILRLLQQLGKVYRTITVAKFTALAPAVDKHTLERAIVHACAEGQVQLRINHQKKCLIFQEDNMESSRMRQQLTTLAVKLQSTVGLITCQQPVNLEKSLKARKYIYETIKEGVKVEHEAVFERQKTIERRKQHNETENARKKESAEKEKKEMAEKRLIEERTRLDIEKRRREIERQKKEKEDVVRREKEKLAQDLQAKVTELESKGVTGKAVKKLLQMTENLDEVDADALLQAERDVLIQQNREREQRMREEFRRLDYTVRALRTEEIPILEQFQQTKKLEAKESQKEQFLKFCENHKAMHERGLEEKHRLMSILQSKKEYTERKTAQRYEALDEARKLQFNRIVAKRKEMHRDAEIREEQAREEKEKARMRAAEQERREKREEEERQVEDKRREQEEAERDRNRGGRGDDRGRDGDRGRGFDRDDNGGDRGFGRGGDDRGGDDRGFGRGGGMDRRGDDRRGGDDRGFGRGGMDRRDEGRGGDDDSGVWRRGGDEPRGGGDGDRGFGRGGDDRRGDDRRGGDERGFGRGGGADEATEWRRKPTEDSRGGDRGGGMDRRGDDRGFGGRDRGGDDRGPRGGGGDVGGDGGGPPQRKKLQLQKRTVPAGGEESKGGEGGDDGFSTVKARR